MTWILFAAIVVLFVLIDASIVLYRECKEKPDDKVPREAFTRDDDYFDLYRECKEKPDDKVPREAFTRDDDYFDKVLNEPHGSD